MEIALATVTIKTKTIFKTYLLTTSPSDPVKTLHTKKIIFFTFFLKSHM